MTNDFSSEERSGSTNYDSGKATEANSKEILKSANIVYLEKKNSKDFRFIIKFCYEHLKKIKIHSRAFDAIDQESFYKIEELKKLILNEFKNKKHLRTFNSSNVYENKAIKFADKIQFCFDESKENKTIANLMAEISDIVIYEVKSVGSKRKSDVTENFKNMGFTLTKLEKENAETLGEKFKFVFLNNKTKKFKKYSLSDFYNEKKANIYETFSVFIIQDLNEQ